MAEEDTNRVQRSKILLNFKKELSKYTVNPAAANDPKAAPFIKGADHIVSGNHLIALPDNLIDYFNIPKFTGTVPADAGATVKIVNIAAKTYKKAQSMTDTTGVDVVRRAHTRVAGKKKGNARTRSVQVPTELNTITGGRQRYVSIGGFPYWWTNIMLLQAVGTMLVAKLPAIVKINGVEYPFVKFAAGATPAGSDDGAWVATAFIAESNTDSPNDPITPGTKSTKGQGGNQTRSDNT